jgi:hypothetical protein
MTRYRIIIEGEATEPPPDYVETLDKIVRKEVKFMLGKAWEVVRTEELIAEYPATDSSPEVTIWKPSDGELPAPSRFMRMQDPENGIYAYPHNFLAAVDADILRDPVRLQQEWERWNASSG